MEAGEKRACSTLASFAIFAGEVDARGLAPVLAAAKDDEGEGAEAGADPGPADDGGDRLRGAEKTAEPLVGGDRGVTEGRETDSGSGRITEGDRVGAGAGASGA